MTRWPRNLRNAAGDAPPQAGENSGGTVEIPTYIASQVVPQTKRMKTTIAR